MKRRQRIELETLIARKDSVRIRIPHVRLACAIRKPSGCRSRRTLGIRIGCRRDFITLTKPNKDRRTCDGGR